MRRGAFTYVLLAILLLMIFGVISFGDVLSVIFYIFMGIIVLVLIGVLVFRYRINRIRRQMENQQGAQGTYRTYTRGTGQRREARKEEGEVTVKGAPASSTKVVSNDVGQYVEYEEEIIEEKKTE